LPALRLLLLGAFDVRYDAQSLPVPPTLKSRSLLAYLVTHRRQPQSRERLASLFWGDRPERKARSSLSTALWHIRRCFPDGAPILSGPHSVQFDPTCDLWLDSEAFESYITGEDTASLEAGLALYRGPFMEGYYDDWILDHRYRLEGLYSEALARLMTRYEAGGEYDGALTAALKLANHDPLREDAQSVAMRAYCRLGQRSAALKQYQRYQASLQEELSVEPTSAIAELYQAILEERFEAGQPRLATRPSAPVKRLPALPAGRSPLDVFVPSSLVGREEELSFLQRCWAQAASERGCVVLVQGEMGIGKTRLVEEFAHDLRRRGARLLWGRCYEFERILPYQPFAEALQAALPLLIPDELGDLSPWAIAEVARLVPEMAEYRGDPLASEPVDPDQQQARLFDGVTRFLAQMSTRGALVMVLDDLHWASESALQMLHYLARHLIHYPVLLVGTLRPEALDRRHPLHALRQQLTRAGLAQTMHLTRLSLAEVETMVVEMSGTGQAAVRLARRLYRETEGNPFFLIELVKALFQMEMIHLEAGAWQGDLEGLSEGTLPLPASLSEAIEARVQSVGDRAQAALRLAAVLGQEFDFDALNAVWGRGEEAALEALDTLLRRRLIDEGIGAASRDYAFTHHKIQEVIYANTPQLHRQRIHARVGAALERLWGPESKESAGEIAFHFEQGQRFDGALTGKAIAYLLQAGDRARQLYACLEAIGYYRRALVLLREQKEHEQAARTLMKLGLAYHNAFDFRQARWAYEEGFALWQRAGESHRRAPPSSPAAPHALRVDWTDPPTLDPTKAWDLYSACVIDQLFSGLVEYTPEMGVTPDVSEGWEVSQGGRRYVFRLRTAVRWIDGTPVTAGDFEYAWKRVLDPASKSANAELLYDIKGARALHQGELSDPDRLGVRALNDATLVVELEEPSSYFPSLLAHRVSYPLPRHAVQDYGERWADVGTILTNGPFRLESWEGGESLVLVRNPEYHGRVTGNAQRLELCLLPAWSAILQMYEADGLDIMNLAGLPGPERQRVRQRFAGDYVSTPTLGTMYVGFDTSRPPFDDPRVRRAFVQAIDREHLAFVVMRGDHFSGTGGFIPPGMPGHSEEIGLPHDPNEARRSLDEIGCPAGRGLVSIDFLTFRRLKSYAEVLASRWQDVLGVEIAWEAVEYEDFQERMGSEPPRVFLSGWTADYLDPDNFLRVSPIRRYTRWQDSDFDRLVEMARRVTDQRERMSLYRQADGILIRETAIVPITYVRRHLLVKPWIRTLPMSPIKHWFWKDTIIEPH
jgi:ABC-type oligopeptide transport system substrate-binding subunit/DNA-binding SARP family transcriptional activator